jgi:hypothetical protein
VKAASRVRVAIVLWLVFAAVVWNVIFDRVLVLAGRRYVWQAYMAADADAYLPINDVMPQAIHHGVRVASLWSGLLAVAGLALIIFAARRPRT